MNYIAHTINDRGVRHDLVTHLQAVSGLARQFAEPFGAGELAAYAGLCHDIGKFSDPFQKYLLACEANPSARGRGPDHKAAGTTHAMEHVQPLAMLVQGHHGGLKNRSELPAWLAEKSKEPHVAQALALGRQLVPGLLPLPRLTPPTFARDALAGELFMRMLFSTLVDADCLDTEAHCNPETSGLRGNDITMTTLWERFARDQGRLLAAASGEVGKVRAEVYQACLEAAEHARGLFRLTVPTGGGKTRSGLAFALRHALRHGMRRIIMVVPFITITEQTANTYREILWAGEDDAQPVVLEHHSAVEGSENDDGDFHQRALRRRLAAENWDAPVIVTTTVQFFQSLFACRTQGVRKLHNIANSVVILDEAQALPLSLLTPILDVLRQLCANYRTSVVLSTATQPAFEAIPSFAGLPAHEIVPEPARHFAALRRVSYDWRLDTPVSWDQVSEWMRVERACLTVVNTKKDAQALLDALDDPEALHLSTLLCGLHRRRVIEEVKRRLGAGIPCRLVTTQVVEAGVDLDFPLVLRALGPLDSIIQAAGRCNREGKLAQGRVIVFLPDEGSLPGKPYELRTQGTKILLAQGLADPDDPLTSKRYFEWVIARSNLDKENVQELRKLMDYPEVATRFRMIEEDAESVAVQFGTEDEQREVERTLDQLRAGKGSARAHFRRLQPYLVSLRSGEVRKNSQWISPVVEGLGQWQGKYDQVRGLLVADPPPEAWVF